MNCPEPQPVHSLTFCVCLLDQTPPQVPYNDEDSDMDSEGAYDLREVSSDVEVDPAELDSDQR